MNRARSAFCRNSHLLYGCAMRLDLGYSPCVSPYQVLNRAPDQEKAMVRRDKGNGSVYAKDGARTARVRWTEPN
jgi:hypothetical protein